ncbi:hypothetical protein CsSME_00000665 [Camellia sinensis var. sinensis]
MSLIFLIFLSLQLHFSPHPPPPLPPMPATSTPPPHHVLSISTSFADSFNPPIIRNSTPISSLVTTSRPVSDSFNSIISLYRILWSEGQFFLGCKRRRNGQFYGASQGSFVSGKSDEERVHCSFEF